MRFIIYGVGAIGGVVAASLHLSGHEVVGIARGAQLAAIKEKGLLLRTPEWSKTATFPIHGDPTEIAFRPDDVVLLTMKGQDTEPALRRLRDAGLTDQPVLCGQNGVANERAALRLFPNVYGVTVMMPADYIVPGEVYCYSVPKRGIFDIGRYPNGRDDVVDDVADALNKSDIATFPLDDVMQSKYGKLLMNLGNVMEAAMGRDGDRSRLHEIARAEGEAVYRAAGITAANIGMTDPRRAGLMEMQPIEGITRAGGSSTQSLMRGAGSIETDYLNGEIALLGRLHGVPTPINSWFTNLGARLVREGLKPGDVTQTEVEAALRALGADI